MLDWLRVLVALLGLAATACATASEPVPVFEPPELEIAVPEPDLYFPESRAEVFAPGPPGKPLLWYAQGKRGSFYLFGSVHAGDARTADLGARAEAAYESSDEVVLELDLTQLDLEQTRALAAKYGTLEPPATLQSVVSPETWALLEKALARAGLSVEDVQPLQPWLVSFSIASGMYLAAGLDPAAGVDQRVAARAQGKGLGAGGGGEKPVIGLETPESQLQMLASLPLPVQERLLRDTLAPDTPDALDPSQLVESWKRGDVNALSELLEPSTPESAFFFEHLIYRRNEAMADRLEALAVDGKQRFVVVGILHLVGERGIPSLLARRGYLVSRIN